MSDFIKIADAASRLGVEPKTIYRLIKSGKLTATKPSGGVYLIRVDDVNTLLAQGRSDLLTTITPTSEVLRCGRCLRLIESDAQIGGVCAHEACEEVLCVSCWGDNSDTAERLCHKHSPTREQRYAQAQRAHNAGQLKVLVASHEARQRELTFISRFDQKVRQIVTLKNPVTNTVYKNIDWNTAHSAADSSAEVMSLLNTGFLDAEAASTLPFNSRSLYTLGAGNASMMLEARVLTHLEKHIADGFDTAPIGMASVLPLLQETIQSAEKSNRAYALGLASPTRWSSEAVDYVASTQTGRAFSHRLMLLYLIDLSSGRVSRNIFDSRSSALASLFSILLPEEEIEQAMRAVREAVVRHGSITLKEAVADTQFSEDTVKAAFDRLVATGSFAIADVRGVGLAITRS